MRMERMWFFSWKRLLGIAIVFLAIVCYFLLPAGMPEAVSRSVVLFGIAALFWAIEIIPLYATSISLVVFLTLFLTKPGGALSLDQRGFTLFFSQFANPIIFLFFGGLILARALNKYEIDKKIAQILLSKLSINSFSLLTGHLLLTAFLSMWISNTAAAAIVLALLAPLMVQLEKNDPLKKGLPIAVAFGASIGGIATPIGTPPNALAMGILAEHGVEISFLQWMGMTVPLAVVILMITSFILWLFFSSKMPQVVLSYKTEPLSKKGKAALLGAIAMILLWISSPWHKIPESLVALLGVSYFATFELIDLEDLKRIEWDVLFLMWGGLALGEAIKVSKAMPFLLGPGMIADSGIGVFVIFCLVALLLSTFMSNTAAANLLLPVIISFSPENKILLSVTIALSCSLAMTLPISTPPNSLAYAQHTFSTRDMLKPGLIISLFGIGIILLGFDKVIPFFL